MSVSNDNKKNRAQVPLREVIALKQAAVEIAAMFTARI